MHTSWLSSSRRFQISLQCVCCCVLVAGSVPGTANEDFLSKPPQQWTEAEALQVLNDSPWAHTITTTTQDFQCDYEHPAYPESYRKGRAEELDSMVPTPPATDVKSDGAEYLVRFLSVKPMQAAVERLLSLDPEKWGNYRTGYGLKPGLKPTNLEELWYNPADEITIVIVLKRSGPGGASFRDYAFHRKDEPKSGLRHLWPCAAVKTANGVTTAVVGGPVRDDGWNAPKDIVLSFPSTSKGKPLIAHPNEKLDFRFVANQHVFETTFYLNPSDLFDGTETMLHIPRTVDEPTPATVP
jgi:hypothetical protein